MRRVRMLSGAALAMGLAACTTIESAPLDTVGEARLSFADGRPAGTAKLLRDAGGLQLQIFATGMSPGPKGFHLHTTGKCEAPGFASAGGHLNPGNRKHGNLSPGGPHLGDLLNLEIGLDGSGRATEAIGAGPGALDAIFDLDGTAIVIHAGPDDYRTDPSGNSGDRVACGILRRS